MKKFFEEPIVEVNTFAVEDIITVSGFTPGSNPNCDNELGRVN